MKNRVRFGFGWLRYFLICCLISAVAVVSMPLGAFARSAVAEEKDAEQAKPVADSRTAKDADVAALPDFTLNFVYYRPAGDYDGWNVWLWCDGNTDTDYTNGQKGLPFTQSSVVYGKSVKMLSYKVSGCVPKDGKALGFIVRLNDWASKDVEEDRFITVDDINRYKDAKNRVTVYLVQGMKPVYFNMEDAMTDKITLATFTSFTNVDISTNAEITAGSKFVVKDGDDNVCGTLDCSLAANKKYVGTMSASIPFTADFDFNKSYTVYDESDDGFTSMGVQITKLYDTAEFGEAFDYTGTLGAEYSKAQTKFTVWAPTASDMMLNIYNSGDKTDTAKTAHNMTRGTKGEWTAVVAGDLDGKYYTYTVTNADGESEVVDPYARSGGRNGVRGMILDLDLTDPEGWNDAFAHKIPDYGTTADAMSKAVIWEAQLRDITIHESSGVSEANRGKFLGLTETGTKTKSGKSTALDYIKELGVTQVHFQPLFDFASVEENFATATYNKNGEYNWGYDPLNYNMPEGSYSSNPADGRTRVNEMKQMIMALHNAGIQVIMDVVYNHVSNAGSSNFEKLVPGYYFRMSASGEFLNGSGCGNETASEHYMFRKFMIDSVKYWTEEYKIDGFRFDLMGLHDVTTMNELYAALKAVNPDVIVYGEGWDAGTNGLPESDRAIISNASKMPNVAVFNDIIRDGMKGSVFTITDTGYATGKGGTDAAVYVGAAGATSALDSSVYKTLGGDKKAFAVNPTQNVNYVSAHDNSALWDKINASVNAKKQTLMAMNRLSATAVLTSQGASFFLAGEEMMRSKPTTADGAALYDNRPQQYLTDPNYYFSDNSYKSADSVNAINWDNLDNADVAAMVEYYKQLIAIKKTFKQFNISTTAQLSDCFTVCDENFGDGISAYAVKDPESDNYAVLVFNATSGTKSVTVPKGEYAVYVNGAKADAAKALSTLKGNKVSVGAYSAVVMVGTLDGADSLSGWKLSASAVDGNNGDTGLGLALGLGIGIPAAAIIAGGVAFAVLRGKKKGGKGKAEKDRDGAQGGEREPENDDVAQSNPDGE